jgi:tRNA U38,U39,U40 pseudouridine synthase TruA
MSLMCAGGKEDDERMLLLRECLRLCEGVHPFHNFTKRRLYRDSQRQHTKRKAKNDPPAGGCTCPPGRDAHLTGKA